MGISINLIGQTFGKLTVIGIGNNKISSNRIYKTWKCKCDCGTIIETKTNQLTSGKAKSCGCLRHEFTPKKYLAGDRYYNLTLIKPVRRDKYKKLIWLCRCDCGNEKELFTYDIKVGKVQSCGCLWKERLMKRGSDHFKWDSNKTDEERIKGRRFPEYIEWVKNIYKRDNYTCQICGLKHSKKNPINAHHIESYNSNLDLRINIDNGITLCKKCHNNFHHQFGYGDNTKEDLINFIKNRGD